MISLSIDTNVNAFGATLDAPSTTGPGGGSGPNDPPGTNTGPTITVGSAVTGTPAEGFDLTLTITALTGTPTPATALTSLTLDGVDVLATVSGTGPWVYALPSSATPQTVAWTVTAVNSEGIDTASGSEVVEADLTAPSVSATGTLTDRTLSIAVTELSGTPTPSTVLSSLTLDGVDVRGDVIGAWPWTYTVPSSATPQTLAWTITSTNAQGTDTASGSETVAADLGGPVAPSVSATGTLTDRTLSIAVTELSGTPTPATVLSSLTLDGVDVRGDVVGAWPWTYTVPSSEAAQTLAWTITSTNSEGVDTASGAETVAADLITPPQPGGLTLGALTPVGEGALPLSGVADGTYGDFTVAGGLLTARVSPLTPGTYDVAGEEITVTANAVHVANATELAAARGRSALAGLNATVYLRAGTYANNGYDSINDANLTPITFAADDAQNPPVLERWTTHPSTFSGTIIRNGAGVSYTLENLTFDFTEAVGQNGVNRTYQDLATGTKVVWIRSGEDVVLRGCKVNGNLLPAAQGGRAFSTLDGISIHNTCTDVTVENCEVYNIQTCYELLCSGARLVGSTGHDFHGDFISSNGYFNNGAVINNHAYDPSGNGSYQHPDFLQVNTGQGHADGLEIIGNTCSFGNVGRPVYDKIEADKQRVTQVYSNDSAYLAINPDAIGITGDAITLDPVTHAYRDLSVLVAAGTTVTVTLPSCAASNGQAYFCQIVGNRTGAQLAFALAPGDSHAAGPLTPVSGNQVGYSFASTGGTQWHWQELGRIQWDVMVRRNWTLSPIEDGLRVLVSTNDGEGPTGAYGGDRTLTLPLGSPDTTYGIQRIFPDLGTVTVAAQGGELISVDGGPAAPTLTLDEGHGYQIAWTGAQWLAERDIPTLQGVFSNMGITNSTIAGNILMAHAPNLIWPEQTMDGTRVFNNTVLNTPILGHPKSPEPGRARLNGANALGQRNYVQTQIERNDGAVDIGTVKSNLLQGADMTPALSLLAATTLAELRPTTRAEVFAAARAQAGGPLDTGGIGAVGATDTGGFFNPTTGLPNPGYGTPILTGTLPMNATAYPRNGTCSLTFDQFIETGTGDVVLYNVTDDTPAQVIPVSDRQISISENVLTLTPDVPLPEGKQMELRMGPGVVASRLYGPGFAGLGAGAFGWTTTATAQSDFERVYVQNAYLTRNSGLTSPKTGLTKALIAMRIGMSSSADYQFDLFNIFKSAAPLLRGEVFRDTGRLIVDSWNRAIQFQVLTSAIAVSETIPQTLLISIDTTAPTLAEGVKIFLGNEQKTVTEITWTPGATFNLTEATATKMLYLLTNRRFAGPMDFAYIAFPSTLPDISQPAVRDGFQFLNLGADGSGPTGEVPEIFFTGLSDLNAGTNRGSGGDYGPTGTFTAL